MHHPSVAALRTTFLATAQAMFGPGHVWLVAQRDWRGALQLMVLNTYLAGSPYPGAHFRRHHGEAPGEPAGAYRLRLGGHQAREESRLRTGPTGIELEPLLCVSTWEHVYMWDYGPWGKMQYLERWWDRIDWRVVNSHWVGATAGGG